MRGPRTYYTSAPFLKWPGGKRWLATDAVWLSPGQFNCYYEPFLGSAAMSLDAVPPAIALAEVRTYLSTVDGVRDVHDLHVWSMSTTETALTAHLVMRPTHSNDIFLTDTANSLRQRFNIEHATIQIETGAGPGTMPNLPTAGKRLIAKILWHRLQGFRLLG